MTSQTDRTPPLNQGELFLRPIGGYLHLILPIGNSWLWEEILGQLNIRLESSAFPPGGVILEGAEYPIESMHLQALITTLERYHFKLHKVITASRSTAIVAATGGISVEQISSFQAPNPEIIEPLYLQKIIRSGVVIEHPGSVILRGEVHPGGEIIAGGDILVWGKLKGRAHAGASGNGKSIIMALQLIPTQLQIAEVRARVDGGDTPEVAYLNKEEGFSISIVSALEYFKL